MKNLKVFADVDLPVEDASIQKYVVLAMSESGKTYLTLKFEEQLCDAGLYFVTLDPVGKHWALRAGAEGSPEGGKQGVYVLGGMHGDVPLEPDSGALIADVVIDHPGQYVIDISTFETNADQDRFATAFAMRLFRRKAKDPGFPLTVILEEAEEFIPQVARKDQLKLKGAFSRIQKIGRNHGLGTWAVSQRAASLDKGFISQASVLIPMRMSHKRDRNAIDEWVEAKGSDEQRDKLMQEIAAYEQGECTVWSPAWLKTFTHTRVLERETFDSSASVKAGRRAEAIDLTPLDVDALGESIKQLAVKAEQEDPKKLQDKILKLERDLAHATKDMEDFEAAQDAVRELEQRLQEAESAPPALTGEELAPIAELSDELAGAAVQLQSIREILEGRLGSQSELGRSVRPAVRGDKAAGESRASVPPPPPSPRAAVQSMRTSKPPDESGDVDLKPGDWELLWVYASFPDRAVSPQELGVITGKAHTAGPFRGAINRLHKAGYVSGDMFVGGSPIGQGIDISITGTQDRWRKRLKPSEARVLELAIDRWPEYITPAEIGEAIGKDHNAGPIRGMFNRLSDLGVIAYDKQLGVRASDYLMQR